MKSTDIDAVAALLDTRKSLSEAVAEIDEIMAIAPQFIRVNLEGYSDGSIRRTSFELKAPSADVATMNDFFRDLLATNIAENALELKALGVEVVS